MAFGLAERSLGEMVMNDDPRTPASRDLRLGRDDRRSRQPGAGRGLRRDLRAPRRRDHDGRGARADGPGQARPHRRDPRPAPGRRRLAARARPAARRGRRRPALRRLPSAAARGAGGARRRDPRRARGRRRVPPPRAQDRLDDGLHARLDGRRRTDRPRRRLRTRRHRSAPTTFPQAAPPPG